MRRILVTGALGQIGSELALRERYGAERVVASDLGIAPAQRSLADGIYDHLDCTQPQQICEVMRRHDLVQSMIASGSENAMSDSVDKVIEVIGTSSKSWEAAAAAAVKRTSWSMRDLRIAEMTEQDVQIKDGKIEPYWTKLKLSFKFEGSI